MQQALLRLDIAWRTGTGFHGFGPCAQAGGAEVAHDSLAFPSDRRQARRLVSSICPPVPGVYGMVDAAGELIYVGKSKSLRSRLLSYLAERDPHAKSSRIIRHCRRLVWETAPTELAALFRELELIRRWRPRFNRRGQPGGAPPAYLCVGRGPAPYAYLERHIAPHAEAAFGPVAATRGARRLVRMLNRWFRLRDCPQSVPIRYADQSPLFSVENGVRCPRLEMEDCLAPCAGHCNFRQYARQVKHLADFLRGRNDDPLLQLTAAMARAAQCRNYEEAAVLRDTLDELEGLRSRIRQLDVLRQTYNFVYPSAGYQRRRVWYAIRRGMPTAVFPAPRSLAERRTAAALLEDVFHARASATCEGAAPGEDFGLLTIVAEWFRRYPRELRRTLSPHEALARCRPSSSRR